jgi:hypothetical protein
MEKVLLMSDVITPPFFVEREAGQKTAIQVNQRLKKVGETKSYRARAGENGEHLMWNSCDISRKRIDFSASYAVRAY